MSREKAKRGLALVYAVEEKKISNFNEYFRELGIRDAIEFKGEELPHYIAYIQELDTVREATVEERIRNGQYQFSADEYLDSENILRKKPNLPFEMAEPLWNNKKYRWEEGANFEGLKEHLYKQNKSKFQEDEAVRKVVLSKALGFLIDCSMRDLEIQKIYKEIMEKNQILNGFKCGDNAFRTLSSAEIEIMIAENKKVILQVYENKFRVDKLIDSAKTLEELQEIKIEYHYSL